MNIKELQYLNDTDFLLTKNEIIKKLWNLLSEAQQEMRKILLSEPNFQSILPPKTDWINGKISKGENYRGLPYLVLDYPKLFSHTDTFSVRTMCWWGNEWSCTLHLSGNSLTNFREKIANSWHFLQKNECFLGLNAWEYHFQNDNYLPIQNLSETDFRTKILEQDFIKISKRYDLQSSSQIPAIIAQNLKIYFELLTL